MQILPNCCWHWWHRIKMIPRFVFLSTAVDAQKTFFQSLWNFIASFRRAPRTKSAKFGFFAVLEQDQNPDAEGVGHEPDACLFPRLFENP